MRRVYGIGETIYDIIFRDNMPCAGRPGGSTFNALISLGRSGVDATFISELGDDNIGGIILAFMKDNGISIDNIIQHKGRKSSVSLAFLNEESDAEYSFYKDYGGQKIFSKVPNFQKDDIVLFGSYFALNPALRSAVTPILEAAKEANAIIYYDPNFRDSHLPEVSELLPTIISNMESATIVRGSDEDFYNIFNREDKNQIYNLIKEYCSNLIITEGSKGVTLFRSNRSLDLDGELFKTPKITPVSTIGAGDNFNAGFIFGLLKEEIGFEDLQKGLDSDRWAKLIGYGISFSTEVCQSYDNYISGSVKY